MTTAFIRKLQLVFVLGSVVPLFAQDSVDSRHQHERITAVVPIIGAGTYADPHRPLFAPAPNEPRRDDGVQSFEWVPSDDGKYAVVEFVAFDRKAFEVILGDKRVVKAMEKGKVKRVEAETELRRYRKDFTFDRGGKQQ